MKQFDIVGMPDLGPQYRVIILQHDFFDDFRSRLVAPLTPDPRAAIAYLTPRVLCEDRAHFILLPDLASVSAHRLGPPIDNAEAAGYEIVRALDRLFTGL